MFPRGGRVRECGHCRAILVVAEFAKFSRFESERQLSELLRVQLRSHQHNFRTPFRRSAISRGFHKDFDHAVHQRLGLRQPAGVLKSYSADVSDLESAIS